MACRLHPIGLCLWLTLFWEKGWGPPCDSHQGICGGWEWLVENMPSAGQRGSASSCRVKSQMCGVIFWALLTESIPRTPHGLPLDWGPRCASRRQDRAQRTPAVKYLLIVSPDVSPDIGHILTICEGQLFSFVLTSTVKMSHPAAVMLWVVFQLVGWIMPSIHIPFLRPHDLHFWDLMPGFEMLPVTVTLTSGRTAWTGSNWHLYAPFQG